MMDHFMTAAKADPQHYVLIQNVEAARAWFTRERPGDAACRSSSSARHDFQLLERTAQPTLPGPLPDDFADWDRALTSPHVEPQVARVGSTKGLGSRKRLKVV